MNVYNNKLKPVASINYNYNSKSNLYRVTIDSLPNGAKLISTNPLFVEPLFERTVRKR